jgi:protease II
MAQTRRCASAGEQVVLDENALAGDHAYFNVGAVSVAPDGALVAYAVDSRGDERHELHIRMLPSAAHHPANVAAAQTAVAAQALVLRGGPRWAAELEWGADSRSLYVVELVRLRICARLASQMC